MGRKRTSEEIERDKESAWKNAPHQGSRVCHQCGAFKHCRGNSPDNQKCKDCHMKGRV